MEDELLRPVVAARRSSTGSSERPQLRLLWPFGGERQVSPVQPPLIASGRMTRYDPHRPVVISPATDRCIL